MSQAVSVSQERQPEINKLLLSMAVPMMISMLVQALYNIVDSIFVSYLCEDALTAVSLAFPVQNIMIAVCTGTGVGINAFVSRALGSRDTEKANRTANNGILLALFSYIGFAVLIGSLGRVFFSVQTDDQQIVSYGASYIRIIGVLSFGMCFQITLERLLQSTGKTIYSMITQTTGAVINIILDPILIFGLLGFPRMEVAGAALATVIGQIAASSLALYFNLRHNPELKIDLKKYRIAGKVIKEIYSGRILKKSCLNRNPVTVILKPDIRMRAARTVFLRNHAFKMDIMISFVRICRWNVHITFKAYESTIWIFYIRI